MKKDLNIEIGKRVREARQKAGLSREQLAELAHISTLFVSYIECGQKGMSFETLITFCQILNISADFLLFGSKTDASPHMAQSAHAYLDALPSEYLPLAEECLRNLNHTIVTVTNKLAGAPRIAIAARDGRARQITLDADQEAQLTQALETLKNDG